MLLEMIVRRERLSSKYWVTCEEIQRDLTRVSDSLIVSKNVITHRKIQKDEDIFQMYPGSQQHRFL